MVAQEKYFLLKKFLFACVKVTHQSYSSCEGLLANMHYFIFRKFKPFIVTCVR